MSLKNETSSTDERIIEVRVTTEDLEKMKADGISENDLPQPGIKRYRPARHILKEKLAA